MSKDWKNSRMEGEIKSHEKEMMNKARLRKLAELEDTFTSLKPILGAIKEDKIKYGINSDYYFVIDEDGELVFLKRPIESVIGKPDPNMDGEDREQWPYNSGDGKVLWRNEIGKSGIEVTQLFLDALDIKFLM